MVDVGSVPETVDRWSPVQTAQRAGPGIGVMGIATQPGDLMGSLADRNKAVVVALWDAMNTRQHDALDDLIAVDVVRHCPATPDIQIRNLDEFRAFLRGFDEAFPDNVQTLTRMVADDTAVAVWSSYSGTQLGAFGPLPPTGRRAEFEFAAIFRVSEGKVAEWWITWDNMGVLAQLGALD